MSSEEITIVRIYLREHEQRLQAVLDYLRDTAQVRGWTVYRGVSGMGNSGKVHATSLVSMSLDLPITVEFFERRDKVAALLDEVTTLAGEGHVVHWPALLNQPGT